MYWQARLDRVDKDREVKKEILKIRKKHKNYGYRRVHAELRKQGLKINRKKTQRIDQGLNLQVSSYGRKHRKYNSYKGVQGRIAPNRLNRRFKTNVLNQKITTDTKEFKYYETDSAGKLQIKRLYLDPFMDLYNLEIVSYKISKQPNKLTMLEALKEAIERTKNCKHRRTFHSDRGWAYQMKEYQALLKENEIYQSMSRKGNCYDNSPMENFFGILKQEIYHGYVFKSCQELETGIERFIDYYNEERIKEKLDWMSPVQFRKMAFAA